VGLPLPCCHRIRTHAARRALVSYPPWQCPTLPRTHGQNHITDSCKNRAHCSRLRRQHRSRLRPQRVAPLVPTLPTQPPRRPTRHTFARLTTNNQQMLSRAERRTHLQKGRSTLRVARLPRVRQPPSLLAHTGPLMLEDELLPEQPDSSPVRPPRVIPRRRPCGRSLRWSAARAAPSARAAP
jgi:hypothetical protein